MGRVRRLGCVLVVLALLVAAGGCAPRALPTPTPVALPPTPAEVPTLAPAATSSPWPAVTAMSPPLAVVPLSSAPTPFAPLFTFASPEFGITLQYPAAWQAEAGYERRLAGADGFAQVGLVGGTGLTIEQVAQGEAQHKLQPYGNAPQVTRLSLPAGEAVLILPSTDQPAAMRLQAAIVIRLPQATSLAGQSYSTLIVWADEPHIRTIAASLRWTAAP